MRKSTLFEFKHSTNSRKSRLSGIRRTPLLDREEDFDALFRSHFAALLRIDCVGLSMRFEDANHFLHAIYFSVREQARIQRNCASC